MNVLHHDTHFILIGNVALEKPATQIGTYLHLSLFIADRAVDGNTNPHVFNNSCALPDSFSPNIPCWWYVDLGDLYRITKVILYNRHEAYSARKISTLTIIFSDALLSITSYCCISLSQTDLYVC